MLVFRRCGRGARREKPFETLGRGLALNRPGRVMTTASRSRDPPACPPCPTRGKPRFTSSEREQPQKAIILASGRSRPEKRWQPLHRKGPRAACSRAKVYLGACGLQGGDGAGRIDATHSRFPATIGCTSEKTADHEAGICAAHTLSHTRTSLDRGGPFHPPWPRSGGRLLCKRRGNAPRPPRPCAPPRRCAGVLLAFPIRCGLGWERIRRDSRNLMQREWGGGACKTPSPDWG